MSLLKNNPYELNGRRSMNYDEKTIILNLIRSGNYTKAKEISDIFIKEKGVTVTSINNASFNLVERLKRLNPEKARELCRTFSDYKWHYWLD